MYNNNKDSESIHDELTLLAHYIFFTLQEDSKVCYFSVCQRNVK